MPHNIQGFVARENELRNLLAAYKSAHVIPLTQGFAFAPMTDALYEELTNANREFLADIADERFLYLSSKLFQTGREFSKTIPVAYLETDYHGGEGFQKAVAWDDGNVRYSPSVAGNEEGFQKDSDSYPINSALSWIGVQGYLTDDPERFGRDEFEELELDKFRSNEDWINSLTKEI
jgi:hypothetical protein